MGRLLVNGRTLDDASASKRNGLGDSTKKENASSKEPLSHPKAENVPSKRKEGQKNLGGASNRHGLCAQSRSVDWPTLHWGREI